MSNGNSVTREELKEVIIQLGKSFDEKLDKSAATFDEKLNKMAATFNEKLDKSAATFDKKLDKMALAIGKNVSNAISNTIKATTKESDERIMKFEKVQTDRLLKALDKYEKKTEQHDRYFNTLKDEMDKDKKMD